MVTPARKRALYASDAGAFDAGNESRYRHRVRRALRRALSAWEHSLELAMNRTVVLMAALTFAAAAWGQQFKWVDKDGKVRYGDVPPPGVKATPLRAPAGPASASAAPAAKDAKKGPLTPAEQEQEFRRRQQEADKAAEKAAQAQKEAETKRQNCEGARQQLVTIESGQRIARTDAKGERYYLDDAQTAQELARARQAVQQWCN
jgi:hypothetical protein